MDERKNDMKETIDEIRRRHYIRLRRIKQQQKDKGISEGAGNFEFSAKTLVGNEIIEENSVIRHHGFPENEDLSQMLTTPDMYKYCYNKAFLKELVRINPAYIVCAPKDIIMQDETFIKLLAQHSPMSGVHLFGEGIIEKKQFLDMIKANPIVLQNYCANGDYGVVDNEMLDATLDVTDKKWSDLQVGFDVFQFCIKRDFENYEYTDELIEFMAKYSLNSAWESKWLDEILEQKCVNDGLQFGQRIETIKQLLIKYPQAVRAMNPMNIEEFDVLADRDEMKYIIEHTQASELRDDYIKDFEKLDSEIKAYGGHIYQKSIQEAMKVNPEIERFYLMSDEEFSEYMESFVEKQRAERGMNNESGVSEVEATKQRIKAKSQELNRLRNINRANNQEF